MESPSSLTVRGYHAGVSDPKPAPEEDEDLALFRKAMDGVRPLPAATGRVTLAGRKPSTRALQQEADDQAVLREMLADPEPDALESGDTLQYRAPGLPDAVFRRLRRGQYRLELELDLHGLNREKARAAIATFLALCQDRDLRCVRIIHGKGHGSPNSGPILKRALDGWLRKRRDVLAFCSARPVDGGTGAIYVLLRRAD